MNCTVVAYYNEVPPEYMFGRSKLVVGYYKEFGRVVPRVIQYFHGESRWEESGIYADPPVYWHYPLDMMEFFEEQRRKES